MNASMSVNVAEFQKQIDAIVKVGKLTAAQALNKNAIKVLIGVREGSGGELVKGAVHLTPKAKKARIRKDLGQKVTAVNWGRNGTHKTRRIFALASKMLVKQGITMKGKTLQEWNGLVAAAATKIATARDESRAYLAAGWLNCLTGLGHTGKARGVKVYPGRKASKSYAVPAESGNLVVSCYNAAAEEGTPAGEIIETALNQAIANATADMEKYTKRKMEEAMQRAADIAEAQKGIAIKFA